MDRFAESFIKDPAPGVRAFQLLTQHKNPESLGYREFVNNQASTRQSSFRNVVFFNCNRKSRGNESRHRGSPISAAGQILEGQTPGTMSCLPYQLHPPSVRLER